LKPTPWKTNIVNGSIPKDPKEGASMYLILAVAYLAYPPVKPPKFLRNW
jgi:hypothetical protein